MTLLLQIIKQTKEYIWDSIQEGKTFVYLEKKPSFPAEKPKIVDKPKAQAPPLPVKKEPKEEPKKIEQKQDFVLERESELKAVSFQEMHQTVTALFSEKKFSLYQAPIQIIYYGASREELSFLDRLAKAITKLMGLATVACLKDKRSKLPTGALLIVSIKDFPSFSASQIHTLCKGPKEVLFLLLEDFSSYLTDHQLKRNLWEVLKQLHLQNMPL